MMEKKIREILASQYELHDVSLTKMEGYDSTNYRVQGDSFRYVLKLYDTSIFDLSRIIGENEILSALAGDDGIYPTPVPTKEGIKIFKHEKDLYAYRLLSFLEGSFWAESPIGEKQVKSLGIFLAAMDSKLLHLRQESIQATSTIWDLENFLENEQFIDYISDPHQKKIVAYFILQFKTFILERLPHLRKSIIHNDANDWNVLLQDGEVSGIIDFGDMVHSRLIYEIAIAGAYICMNQDNPVQIIATLVSAYHKTLALEKKEIDVLYYLIAARLCTSVINSAKTKLDKPDSEYITVSEQGAWDLLKTWISINPLFAQKEWRKAIGQPLNISHKDLNLKRKMHIPSVLSLSYDQPIHMTSAAFQYMYDADGNSILDAYNNIIQVGHCHPHVVNSGQRAMATLNTNTRYLYDSLTDYAERLLGYFPNHLDKIFFVNSGSAASDLAVRLATTHTDRHKMVVLEHGYHGNTNIGINISHYKYSSKGGQGQQNSIIQTELPDIYRGQYRDADAGKKYAEDLKKLIKKEKVDEIAAFIAEPIVGCGGQIPLPPHYLPKVYQHMKSIGALCISDEVQVGFGRLGKAFWGFELHGVEPDIVILGKPIGNGHPMAAVVTTSAIANSFDNGMEFFSSFGGNPVSCAIGNAVLDVIENEYLQKHALQVGEFLKNQLLNLSKTHSCIGDVRGEGLFLGIDIVKDRASREPDGSLAKYIINFLRRHHVLTSLDGPYHNVIKIKPPLCFTQKNAITLINMVQTALDRKKKNKTFG